MGQAMRAIETRYRGILFRSRLEARWAIFFDSASIRWQYEPVGYTNGRFGYLADFYLPDDAAWLEIKPGIDIPAQADEKCVALALETSKPVYIFSDPWWPIARRLYEATVAGWVTNDVPDPPDAQAQLRFERQGRYTPGWSTFLYPPGSEIPVLGAIMTDVDRACVFDQRLANAYGAARSYRFDEQPRFWHIPALLGQPG